MRWIRIREAKGIDPDLRAIFEQNGVTVMQQLLAAGRATILYKRQWTNPWDVRESLMPWLTEQYDRAERRETWSLTMEVAITVFVLAELVLDALKLAR